MNNWNDAINRILTYIEAHLTEPIGIDVLARVGLVSESELRRAFSLLCGMSVGEYIRGRRMAMAAEELMQGTRVIDAAMKYGYDNPDSFSRAFQRFHGLLPSQVKREHAKCKPFPPRSLQVTVTEEGDPNHETLPEWISEIPTIFHLEFRKQDHGIAYLTGSEPWQRIEITRDTQFYRLHTPIQLDWIIDAQPEVLS